MFKLLILVVKKVEVYRMLAEQSINLKSDFESICLNRLIHFFTNISDAPEITGYIMVEPVEERIVDS